MTSCRWNGILHAGALTEEALPWANYFPFAAESELSTGPAFKHMQNHLVNQLSDSGCAKAESGDSRHKLLTEILFWLEAWAAEEENHAAFFRAAAVRCASLSASPKMALSGGRAEPIDTVRYGVLEPIPALQSFERTLFFLLFSEISSMVWYRVWVRRVPSGALLTALKEIHRDEASHFEGFLRFATRLCVIDPLALREARLVRACIARTLQNRKDVRFLEGRNKEIDMNWWENEIFFAVDDYKDIAQVILRIQSATYNRLERNSRAI
jgi:hypothetical protein